VLRQFGLLNAAHSTEQSECCALNVVPGRNIEKGQRNQPAPLFLFPGYIRHSKSGAKPHATRRFSSHNLVDREVRPILTERRVGGHVQHSPECRTLHIVGCAVVIVVRVFIVGRTVIIGIVIFVGFAVIVIVVILIVGNTIVVIVGGVFVFRVRDAVVVVIRVFRIRDAVIIIIVVIYNFVFLVAVLLVLVGCAEFARRVNWNRS